jgi:hypothetical protein
MRFSIHFEKRIFCIYRARGHVFHSTLFHNRRIRDPFSTLLLSYGVFQMFYFTYKNWRLGSANRNIKETYHQFPVPGNN